MNKELIRIIEQSSSEDLSEAVRVIAKTLDERRNEAKKDAWRKVVNTIKDYVTTFGNIKVETDDDTFYLTAHDCYTENGHIVIEYEED